MSAGGEGFSKAMVFTLLTTIVPFYALLIVGLFNPAYFFVFIALGIVVSVVAVAGNSIYGLLHFQSYVNLGTTIQQADVRDRFEDITWQGDYATFGPYLQRVRTWDGTVLTQTFKVVALKGDNGREYLIFLLHSLGDLSFAMADVIKSWTIAKIRTAYVTTVQLKAWHRALADEEIKRPNWFQKHIMQKPDPPTSQTVTALFAYGTPVTGKEIIQKFEKRELVDFIPPSQKLVDDAFKHYAVEQLWLVMDEAKSQRATIEDLHDIIMDNSELQIEIGHETVNEPSAIPWKSLAKILLIGGVAILVIILIYWYLGII